MADKPHAHVPDEEPEPLDPSYLDVVERLSDGGAVDWRSALAGTPARDDALRQLQRLQSVLTGHRRLLPAEPPDIADPPEPALFTWGALAVREKLGEGTFGEVYRAFDARVGRDVALKLRKAQASRGMRRWLDEARKLARVRHANVLVVHGADEHDGRAGIWTELLHGRTLEAILVRNGPMGAREAALIGADLCSALAAVHGAGLIHGDIKTTNIMREGTSLGETPAQTPSRSAAIVEAGRIVLMDFGTATDRYELAADASSRLYATPLTAAPELLDGEDAGPAADLYSLGVVLYRLVTGRYPIEASSLDELRRETKAGRRTPLRDARPDLPATFVDVIERSLAVRPADRFASAAEMERALAGALGVGGAATPARAPAPRPRSRLLRIGVGAALLAVLGLIAWRVFYSPENRMKSNVATVGAAGDAPFACSLLRTLSGSEEYGTFGVTAAAADLNGDGYPDWIAGAPHAQVQRVFAYVGGPDADTEPDIVLTGAAGSNQFGRWVCAGDINGDERVDLLVSETQGETDRGRVFVYFGAIPFDDKPDLVFVGERNYNHFGIRVEVLDFNADGFDDAAVSAYFHDETRGRVYVYFGGTQPDDTADLVFSGENRGDAFGNSLATGDLNHDGVDDLAIASYWNDSRGIDAGRVTVHFGAKAPDRAVDLIFDGAASGENFGNTITAGDYDGDRIDDLVVGAYHSGASGYHAGAVYGFRGGVSMSSAPDLVLLGEAPVDQLGTVVSACDIDRDGAAEIIVAAAGQDYTGDDAGRVYIFAGGKDRDHVAEIVLSGKTKGDGFGICLVPVADIGDGIPGLLIGAHNYGGSSSYSGQAYLYTFASR